MMRLLVLLLLAVTLVPSFAQRSTSKTSQRQLNKQLSQVRETRQDARRKLRQTRRQVNAVTGDIGVVDTRLNQVHAQLEDTTDRLQSSQEQQRALAQDLGEAEKRLAERREQVRQRLRRMYVQGRTSALSGLVRSKSLGELASRQFIYERIADKDREIFTDYRNLLAKVADQKRRQDQIVVRISGLKRDQERQETQLAQVKDEKQDLLQDLKGQQRQLERLLAQLEAEENALEARLAAYARRSSNLPAFTGRFMRPVSGPVTSGFGMRFHPILKVNRLHKGVDFGARSGSPILAAADGIVISASYSSGYGNMVIIDHGGGITTLYAHCSRTYVGGGQRVTRGQRIAAVGSTGLSTAPHLHWEVRQNGRAVNPLGRL